MGLRCLRGLLHCLRKFSRRGRFFLPAILLGLLRRILFCASVRSWWALRSLLALIWKGAPLTASGRWLEVRLLRRRFLLRVDVRCFASMGALLERTAARWGSMWISLLCLTWLLHLRGR